MALIVLPLALVPLLLIQTLKHLDQMLKLPELILLHLVLTQMQHHFLPWQLVLAPKLQIHTPLLLVPIQLLLLLAQLP
ncbi:MAG: hypothetical protein EBT68_02045 [Verrucomicrobia bacterium]|nr:hypothetical protein [Verrucomicrobiota bacterium]